MKTTRLPLILALVFFAAMSAARADLKVGIVDMNQVFTDYYKTKDAQSKYNDTQKSANDDLTARVEKLKKSMAEIEQLNTQLQKPGISKDDAAALQKQLQPKIDAARAMDTEIADYRAAKQKAMQDQFMRMRKDIVDDINKQVLALSQSKGLDLVFDKSGLSSGAIPVVLVSNPSFDFTKDVIAALNKTAPAK